MKVQNIKLLLEYNCKVLKINKKGEGRLWGQLLNGQLWEINGTNQGTVGGVTILEKSAKWFAANEELQKVNFIEMYY